MCDCVPHTFDTWRVETRWNENQTKLISPSNSETNNRQMLSFVASAIRCVQTKINERMVISMNVNGIIETIIFFICIYTQIDTTRTRTQWGQQINKSETHFCFALYVPVIASEMIRTSRSLLLSRSQHRRAHTWCKYTYQIDDECAWCRAHLMRSKLTVEIQENKNKETKSSNFLICY